MEGIIRNGSIVMVRTYSAGVFFGKLIKRKKKEVVLQNATRVWQWTGAASLSQLSNSGTSQPDGCKFPEPVEEIILTEAIEIIKVTDKALETFKKITPWTK